METIIDNSANVVDDLNLTPIQQFYSGANIFITGGTGFLGQILIEKLLRSCPTISTIYMLIRSKKGKDVHSRADEIFEDGLFDRLRKISPKFRHKIVAVAGDCSLPNLGLDLNDRKILIDKVDIVFHVAATVRFDEKLKLAVSINVKSVEDLISLSKEMKMLKVFMHISTAFSNCPKEFIEEKLYTPPISGKNLIHLATTASDELLENLTPKIIGNWPNTYAFTKCAGEDIINVDARGLPLGIFRPAIVISSSKEPLAGWINNYYGPTGVIAGTAAGLLRVLHADSAKDANVVPVDLCVNSVIAAAWEVHDEYQKSKQENVPFEFPIYNYVSTNDKPINWGKFLDLGATLGKPIPTVKAVWCYQLTLQKYFVSYIILSLFLHFIPALVADGALLCLGKKPRLIKTYKKIYKFSNVISYFATRQWKFESVRVRKLINKMTDKDKEIFQSDMKLLDWEEYFDNYLKGIRVYLLNDPLSTVHEARAKAAKFYFVQQTFIAVLAFLLLRILWSYLISIYSNSFIN